MSSDNYGSQGPGSDFSNEWGVGGPAPSAAAAAPASISSLPPRPICGAVRSHGTCPATMDLHDNEWVCETCGNVRAAAPTGTPRAVTDEEVTNAILMEPQVGMREVLTRFLASRSVEACAVHSWGCVRCGAYFPRHGQGRGELMRPPSLADRIVCVSAGLTDQDFGYDHWRAAQFSSPWRERQALLVIIRPGEDGNALRDRIAAAISDTATTPSPPPARAD